MPKYNHAAPKQKKNKTFLIAFLIFLLVIASCVGVIVLVVSTTNPDKKIQAPQAPTPYVYTPDSTQSPTATPAPTATPSPITAADFSKVTASSTRAPFKTESGTITYPASNASDNDSTTVWTPAEDEDNPWIQFSSNSAQYVDGIEIENGYSKSEKRYSENRRAKDISVEFNGKTYQYTLDDSGYGEVQRLAFPETTKTSKIRITINSYYEGTTYEDLCITQITPYRKEE